MSELLPAGWVGNNAFHRTTRGAFTLSVFGSSVRYMWSIEVGTADVASSDALGHPDAATARAAVLARLAEIVGEVDEVPVALTVAELPDAANTDDERAVLVLVDGRPTPARAYVSVGRVRIYSHADSVVIGRDLEVYPESAAPALWRAYLRGRS